jgi:hypothetical protein
VARLVVLVLAGLLALACTAAPPAEPTAQEVRTRAADATTQLKSFRFTLEVLGGTMPLGVGLGATSVDGAVAAPDRLHMTVKARAANMAVEMRVVGIGDRQFLTNPLTGQWQDATGTLSLPRLLDPERGLAATIRSAAGLEKRGRQSQGGVDTFHLAGPVPAAALAQLVGAAQPASGDVQTELWVGVGDYRPRRARLVGPIVAGEAAGLERVLTLSELDAAVQIEAPPV